MLKSYEIIGPRLGMLMMSFVPPISVVLAYFFLDEILSTIQGLPSQLVKIPNVLEMEGFLIILKQFRCGKKEIIFLLYAICQASTEEIRNTISNLATELKTFDNILLNWNVDTESLRNLYPLFEEAFLLFK